VPDVARTWRLLGPLVGDAVAQLRAQWRGHALTLIGLIWGAAAVVLLLSIGAGFNQFLDLGVAKTGDRYVMVWGEYTTTESGGARPGRPIRLDVDDLERVRAGTPSAARVGAAIERFGIAVETPRKTRSGVVAAVTPEIGTIQAHVVARGRFIDAEDERLVRHVAVIGANLAPIFFGDEDPLGRTLQLEGTPFEVVGLLAAKGFQLMSNYDLHDNMVFVPLATGRILFGTGRHLQRLYLDPLRLEDEPSLRQEVLAALRPAHHVEASDAEAIRSMSVLEVMAPTRRIGFGLQLMLGFIGSVTLAMSAVGVANLMIALVQERRMELAMRRACGARRSDLVLQLLVETVVVVLAGGLLGIAFGLAGVGLLGLFPLSPEMPSATVSPAVVATTFFVLSAIGLAAGIVPARIASQVDPAAAMRVT